MQLETERLVIIPLTYEQELKYFACDDSLEDELKLHHNGRRISQEYSEVVSGFILPQLKSKPSHPLYVCTWMVVDKSLKFIVASFGFKGPPSDQNEIEIGYGTESAFQNKGYMSEAMAAAIQWARQQPEIDFIIAETDAENYSSMRVLQKNNFTEYDRKGKMIWWRINCK